MTKEAQIVAIGGLPGSGKTSQVKPYTDKGFTQLSRDMTGGGLRSPDAEFYGEVRRLYSQGVRQFVLDNTWCFPVHRQNLVALANDLGLPVHLRMLDVDVPQAQLFSARRQVQRYGKLFTKEDYKDTDDPNMFVPQVQFKFAKELKANPPSLAEGFASLTQVAVETVWGPEYKNRALLLDLDGTVRVTPDEKECPWPRNAGEVHILDGRRDKLQRLQADGVRLLGVTNQSGPTRPTSDKKYVSEADVQACIDATCKGLGVDIEVLCAYDRGGPPSTYWRKPCSG